MATIPVIIDAVRLNADLEQARCRYYSIGSDDPVSTSFPLNTGRKFPFLLLGLTGIIYKPLGRGASFNKASQIAKLFGAIEKDGSLYVASNQMWIPHGILAGEAKAHGGRGMVYRIPAELFSLAQAFSRGQLGRQDLISKCSAADLYATYSPVETKAFAAWSQQQIEAARKHHQAHPERALKPAKSPTTGGAP